MTSRNMYIKRNTTPPCLRIASGRYINECNDKVNDQLDARESAPRDHFCVVETVSDL